VNIDTYLGCQVILFGITWFCCFVWQWDG